ncbi:3-oxoacyl-ACP synthase III family protein [Alteromonas sp. a30]|uniref:3-oxoacyl-ACP synthase III family protein n=1 Tax=Alteromonas sp. a30 TaxID=2730917 RepID=UPI00227E61DE|nr:3-oxoacyl-[acyl-carrier-protein] synthase III C-terminal domain-containing protein [Alteromonas sp. a30]MCY7297228.1 hypothetical protein [Alteromonas sp. a30]
MITLNQPLSGFHIPHIRTCNFDSLVSLSNTEVLARAGHDETSKLSRFIENKMGITHRYQTDAKTNALDLAKQALQDLIKDDPSLPQTSDFLIYAGISNPLPIATHSALLGAEFGFANPSCWDIKSGCSSGVLALIQAINWLQMGAKRGVIVASETLSKFARDDTLQMSAAVGDGAVALVVEASEDWQVRGLVHGTDPQYVTNMLVEGQIPVANEDYERENFRYTLKDKGNTFEVINDYWIKSLTQLLESSGLHGEQIQHYIAHQIDGSKNAKVAQQCGIPEAAVAKNFRHFGNMGSPTVFINYHQWLKTQQKHVASGENLIFHAVGGGLSWAGICLTRR